MVSVGSASVGLASAETGLAELVGSEDSGSAELEWEELARGR